MPPSEVQLLFSKLDTIIFLLQVLCIASSFLCGFASMQFIIHAKNQKNLF